MRIFTLLLCLSAVTLLSAQTTLNGTLQSGGLTRDYLLYIPAIYNGSTPVPLVLNLHGYTSNNLQQLLYGDFRPIADTANFLIVLPNGTLTPNGDRFWNTFNTGSTVDDVAFISDLIDTLQAVYSIDLNRIYSTGMSNGGFMSYALACGLNDRIAAIASVSGSMTATNLAACQPTHPVPVMEIHGNADGTVPYNGLPTAGFVPIPTLVAAWVAFNHANPTPTFTQVPNTNTSDGATAEHYVYSGGTNGSTVEHYKIIGGGHTWPGTAFTIGVTDQDFSASKEIWRFFTQYRLDELTAAKEPVTNAVNWSISPNPVNDYLLLQANKSGANANQIQVYDARGKLIKSIKPVSGEQTIQLMTANWEQGIYTIVIESNNKAERLRVVKN